jgi:hypothetical protein
MRAPGMSTLARMLLIGALLGVAASPASAALSVVPQGSPQGFDFQTSTRQAGAPADAVASFALTLDSPTPWPGVDLSAGETSGVLRDVKVDLPGGLTGNGQAVPQCVEVIDPSGCPIDSQIGFIDVKAVIIFDPDFQLRQRMVLPLYNLMPSFGEVARLGAYSAQLTLQLSVTLRPGGSSVHVEMRGVPSGVAAVSAGLTIWGVPGASTHDVQRCRALSPLLLSDDFDTVPFCDATSGDPDQEPRPFGGQMAPFFVNGTDCGAPRATEVSVSSWADPTHFESERATAEPLIGCDLLHFEPQIAVRTDSAAPDTPTGLELELHVPATGG